MHVCYQSSKPILVLQASVSASSKYVHENTLYILSRD